MAVTALSGFQQGVTPPVYGVALVGSAGTAVRVTNQDNTDVATWKYEILDAPVGSSIATPVSQGPSSAQYMDFTPDVKGCYRVRTTVYDALNNADVDIRVFCVLTPNGYVKPPFQGLPPMLPLEGVGAKPYEMNFPGNSKGYMGGASPKLLDAVIDQVDALTGAVSGSSLATVLLAGNTTGARDVVVSTGRSVRFDAGSLYADTALVLASNEVADTGTAAKLTLQPGVDGVGGSAALTAGSSTTGSAGSLEFTGGMSSTGTGRSVAALSMRPAASGADGYAQLTGPLAFVARTTPPAGNGLAQLYAVSAAGRATLHWMDSDGNDYMVASVASLDNRVYVPVTIAGTTTLIEHSKQHVSANVAGAVSIQLPVLTALSTGEEVSVKDTAGNAGTYAYTILPGAGSNIDGASSYVLPGAYACACFVYVHPSWQVVW